MIRQCNVVCIILRHVLLGLLAIVGTYYRCTPPVNVCPDAFMQIIEERAIAIYQEHNAHGKADIACKEICNEKISGDTE